MAPSLPDLGAPRRLAQARRERDPAGRREQNLDLPARSTPRSPPTRSPPRSSRACSIRRTRYSARLLVAALVAPHRLRVVLARHDGKRLRRRIDPHIGARSRRRRRSARERLSAAAGCLRHGEHVLPLHAPAEAPASAGTGRPASARGRVLLCVGAGFAFALIAFIVGRADLPDPCSPSSLGGAIPLGFARLQGAGQAHRDRAAASRTSSITLAASLKAGHSFRQGIQAATDEDQGPTTKELKRVLTETSLGRPMDDALQEMSDRVGSKTSSS